MLYVNSFYPKGHRVQSVQVGNCRQKHEGRANGQMDREVAGHLPFKHSHNRTEICSSS